MIHPRFRTALQVVLAVVILAGREATAAAAGVDLQQAKNAGWMLNRAAATSLLPPARLQLAAQAAPEAPGDEPAEYSDHKRYVVPVLLSTLVPGAGEIATGHLWRGLPLVALDVATWFGYAHYQDEGEDWRAAYQAFADEHWNYETWQDTLAAYYDGQYGAGYDWYDPSAPYSCTCPYIPKDEDPQHYYENIGKYLYYYPGWDDWEWSGDPATADSRERRRAYGDMRIESNENFDRGTRMLYLAMATRLVSVIQVTWLLRNEAQSSPRVEVRPLRTRTPAAGLEMSFRY